MYVSEETKEHQFYHQAQNCHGFLGKDNTRCPPVVPLPEKIKVRDQVNNHFELA